VLRRKYGFKKQKEHSEELHNLYLQLFFNGHPYTFVTFCENRFSSFISPTTVSQ